MTHMSPFSAKGEREESKQTRGICLVPWTHRLGRALGSALSKISLLVVSAVNDRPEFIGSDLT